MRKGRQRRLGLEGAMAPGPEDKWKRGRGSGEEESDVKVSGERSPVRAVGAWEVGSVWVEVGTV